MMAGFFKKLFNRITGKGAEEAKPEVVEQVALPTPEEVAVEVIEAVPEVLRAPVVKSKKVVPKKPEPKKVAVKKPEAKKVEAKKPEPKKSASKKVEGKKPEPKKVEAKKVAAKAKTNEKVRTREPVPVLPSSVRRQGPSLKVTDEPVAKLAS